MKQKNEFSEKDGKNDSEKLDLLVSDIEKQAKKRRNFSRRRANNPN